MKVALVCGEPSGDLLGQGLAKALKASQPDIELVGVTGPQMKAAGVESWMDCSVFSIMGYWSAIKRMPRLLQARSKLIKKLEHERPDVFVGIDAPDLNLGLGEKCKELGIRYVQYVCPSFWIWRPKRALQLANCCDLVLSVLPFEAELCKKQNINAKFVGHKLADDIQLNPDDRINARRELGIDENAKLLAILPGSRADEISSHTKLFESAANILANQTEQLEVAWAPLKEVNLALAKANRNIFVGKARTLLQAADIALVKSGTITLEAALLDCPQVIAYQMQGIAAWLTTKKVGADYDRIFGLPNLVAGKKIVPEFIQDNAKAEAIAAALLKLLDTKASSMHEDYQIIRQQLAINADTNASEAVLAIARL